jgi:hypothetical protein
MRFADAASSSGKKGAVSSADAQAAVQVTPSCCQEV